jgi:hypothetical protein
MADNQNPTREELEAMDESELQALAAQRGITVKASDGSSTPSVDDYVEALAPQSGTATPSPSETQGLHVQSPQTAQGKAQFDTTIRGGRYVNTAGKFVNAHGQEIDNEGNVVDGSETPAPPVPE